MRISMNLNAQWEHLQKRRTDLENIRSMNVKRLRADVQRLARREADYAKGLLQEIIPIKVTINEDAVEKLKEFIPFHVELDLPDKDKKVVEPSAVILDEDDTKKKDSNLP